MKPPCLRWFRARQTERIPEGAQRHSHPKTWRPEAPRIVGAALPALATVRS